MSKKNSFNGKPISFFDWLKQNSGVFSRNTFVVDKRVVELPNSCSCARNSFDPPFSIENRNGDLIHSKCGQIVFSKNERRNYNLSIKKEKSFDLR